MTISEALAVSGYVPMIYNITIFAKLYTKYSRKSSIKKKKNRNDRGTNFACRGMRKAEKLGNKESFYRKELTLKDMCDFTK